MPTYNFHIKLIEHPSDPGRILVVERFEADKSVVDEIVEYCETRIDEMRGTKWVAKFENALA